MTAAHSRGLAARNNQGVERIRVVCEMTLLKLSKQRKGIHVSDAGLGFYESKFRCGI